MNFSIVPGLDIVRYSTYRFDHQWLPLPSFFVTTKYCSSRLRSESLASCSVNLQVAVPQELPPTLQMHARDEQLGGKGVPQAKLLTGGTQNDATIIEVSFQKRR